MDGPSPLWASLLVTRGDDVHLVTSKAAFLELLGPIDSEVEAFYLALIGGYEPMCGEDWIRARFDGFEVITRQLVSDCPVTYEKVHLLVARNGSLRDLIDRERIPNPQAGCVGRRPARLLAERGAPAGSSVLGRYFAQIAWLEAASVAAFDILGGELRAHQAPLRLVRAAERARRDEVAHAATTAGLARRFGGTVEAPRVRRAHVRSLRAIAIENAREGCVRETWGALEATWQATRALDAGVRRSMRTIARDETRHAALSWQIAAWAERQLDARGTRAVRAARSAAARDLARELDGERDPELVSIAGLPDAASTRTMLASIHAQLWAG